MTRHTPHARQRDLFKVRVLVACEKSGIVRRAFLDRGYDAWSCDTLPSEDRTNRHIIGEARVHRMPGGRRQAENRSRFYTGIATAMADQWGDCFLDGARRGA